MLGTYVLVFFFFNDTAPPEIYTLSQPDPLPIPRARASSATPTRRVPHPPRSNGASSPPRRRCSPTRSEEHTSELQSRQYLVCRLLLEKKKKHILIHRS